MQYIIDNTPIVEAEFVMPTQIIIDKDISIEVLRLLKVS